MKSKIKITLVLTAAIFIIGSCSTLFDSKSSSKADNVLFKALFTKILARFPR